MYDYELYLERRKLAYYREKVNNLFLWIFAEMAFCFLCLMPSDFYKFEPLKGILLSVLLVVIIIVTAIVLEMLISVSRLVIESLSEIFTTIKEF